MKSMWLPLAAIFFMTYFLRAGEGEAMAPSGPFHPGSATGATHFADNYHVSDNRLDFLKCL